MVAVQIRLALLRAPESFAQRRRPPTHAARLKRVQHELFEQEALAPVRAASPLRTQPWMNRHTGAAREEPGSSMQPWMDRHTGTAREEPGSSRQPWMHRQ